MSSYLIKQFIKGIALRGETVDITENVEGSLFHNSTDQKIKSYIEGAVREVITESQIQTLTNKTISAADNLIVVASTNPNLTSVELNNALTELQNDIDSNSGNLSSHIAALDPHPQYETSVEAQSKVDAHANRVDNPHSVTKTQVGLSNVDNTSDLDKPISTATQTALNSKYDASNPAGYVNSAQAAAAAPVQSVVGKVGIVTLDKSDVGLTNVDNTSDANKPISTATQTALNSKLDASQVGLPNGAASLDGAGKVPAAQLPSYVDDVVEATDFASLPVTGESSKIYVTLDNNKAYRWSGTVYVEVSPSIGSTWGSITGSLINQTDLQSALNAKANSVHTHVSSDITDFNESVDDRISTTIVAGSNISATYDDLANTLTIASTVSVVTDHTALSNIGTNSHTAIDSHIASTSNPHSVTKSQVGLENVDNTSDLNKPISTATQTALDGKQNVLGFTPENISNKSTNTSLGTSDTLYPTQNAVKTYVDNSVSSSSTPDATTEIKGKLKLAGDLAGTADSPTVPGLATKEPTITAGTTSQYFRGDKTFQTLDKSAVGLSNVDNTSDANKPVSTATQTALDGKANTSHTHVASDITNLSEAIDDRISTTIVAGTNVTVAYDDNANTLTISAAGGGSGGATTLDGLTDVSVPSPSNGQALVYNTSTSQWEAQTISSGSGGATELNGLNDVTLSGTLDNQILRYDLASTQWKNETLLKDDIGLSNVDNTSDANKPVSAATQTALDAKVNKAGDRMTGNLEMGTVGYISYSVQPVSDPSFVIGDVVEIYRNNFPYNTTPVLIGTTTVDGTGVISISNITSVITAYFDANGIPYLLSNSPILNEIRYLTNGYNYPNDIFSFLISVPSRSYGPSFDFTQYDAFQTFFNKIKNLDNGVDTRDAVNKSQLDTKANSVHTHVSTDITDFSEAVDDRVSSLLVAGSNITLNYDDLANTLSISAVGAPASTSAERLITNVFNASGSPIPKMSAIYISGIQGDQPKVVLAQANSEMSSSKTYGLVQTDIPDMSAGVIIEQGRLENLDTDVVGWVEGDPLWLSPTTPGGITNVKPSAPNHAVFIGYLIRKHQNVGVIQVSIQNGYELNELHNVSINGITNAQVIQYESATSLWKNHTLVKADVGLSNVDNTSDLDKPISTATQSALDLKANSSHTHVAADITDFNAAVDARIPTIPAAVTSVNGDSGPSVTLDSDDIQEGTTNLYLTNERVDDRVNDLLVAGTGISLNYNDVANTLTITSTVSSIPTLTKGGLLTSDGTQNGELTVGTNGQVLSADSSEPSGLKWIAAGSGSAKYVRGFTFSGALTAGTSGVPVVITSAANINKIKVYGVGISGTWTFDLYKNGAGSPFQSLAISASSVVSLTVSEGVLENDIITCVVNSAGAAGNDFSITLELA